MLAAISSVFSTPAEPTRRVSMARRRYSGGLAGEAKLKT
jgi:hypothetical protein